MNNDLLALSTEDRFSGFGPQGDLHITRIPVSQDTQCDLITGLMLCERLPQVSQLLDSPIIDGPELSPSKPLWASEERSRCLRAGLFVGRRFKASPRI